MPHTASTDTNEMAHFPDVVLRLETPVPPMVHCHLPPHRFNITNPLSCALIWTCEEHAWVVCIIWVDGYLC